MEAAWREGGSLEGRRLWGLCGLGEPVGCAVPPAPSSSIKHIPSEVERLQVIVPVGTERTWAAAFSSLFFKGFQAFKGLAGWTEQMWRGTQTQRLRSYYV